MKLNQILILSMLLFISTNLFSQNQVRFLSENDGYGSFSDRYYTNGGRLEVLALANDRNFTRYMLSGWNDFFVKSNSDTKHWMGFAIGQEFYTPTNISKADVSYGDRPYSSRAYVGHSLTSWTDSSSITTELELGLLGAEVGGKNAQKKFHNYIGSPIPQGWDSQISGPATVGIRTDIRKFYHPFFGTHYNVNLGNAQTDASFGLIFRLGNVGNTPGPGFSALQPGPPILQNSGTGYWYFYINPGVTVQGYNAAIEGPLGGKNKYKIEQRESFFSINSSSYQSESDPNSYLGNYILEALSKDNGNNSLERFALYNLFLVQGSGNPYSNGFNYLLYNNIFNSSEQVESGLRMFLMKSLLEDWDKLGDKERLIAVYSLFRPEGVKINPLGKYLSYEILSNYLLDPNQKLLFLEVLRQNFTETEGKTYVATIKRGVGFFRAGFVSVSEGGFLFSLNYSYSTIDFQSARGLPQGHQWLGFQLGKVF
jgi:hypothetical protein